MKLFTRYNIKETECEGSFERDTERYKNETCIFILKNWAWGQARDAAPVPALEAAGLVGAHAAAAVLQRALVDVDAGRVAVLLRRLRAVPALALVAAGGGKGGSFGVH